MFFRQRTSVVTDLNKIGLRAEDLQQGKISFQTGWLDQGTLCKLPQILPNNSDLLGVKATYPDFVAFLGRCRQALEEKLKGKMAVGTINLNLPVARKLIGIDFKAVDPQALIDSGDLTHLTLDLHRIDAIQLRSPR